MLKPSLLILPLTLLLFGFTDPGSELAIDPPNNFVAVPLPPNEAVSTGVLIGIFRYDADLRSPAPPFCVLALHPREDNAQYDQTVLNARMRDPGRLANIIATFNGPYTILKDEPIALGDVFGHQFIMEAKDAPGGPQDLLQVTSSLDMPEGRLTLNCATERSDLTTNLVSFGLIRESITLP